MLKPILIGSAAQAGFIRAQHNTSAKVGRMAEFKRAKLCNHLNLYIFSSQVTLWLVRKVHGSSVVPWMQNDTSHQIRAAFQQAMSFADLRQRQHHMDRHCDSALFEEFDNNSLIVSRRGAHAMYVDFAADQIDHSQRNLSHFTADRAKGAAETHRVDA